MSETPISVPPDTLLKPGTVVDDYVVEELFSIGASSVVYRARQPSLDRSVALKLLPKDRSANERWVSHFRRGAQLLAAITHPHIVPVYGSGRYAHHEFLAMMFVPGGQAFDRAYPMPQSEAALSALLTAGRDIAKALAFIHQQGLIHGDVKPSNILVAASGHAFLIDFDLAKRPGEAARVGPEGDRASSFLAPEAVAGAGRAADHRSDIYAFGATLYATLAGNPPRSPMPIALQDVRPDLSPVLCAIVNRCVADDPAARFADAEELVDSLNDVLEGLTTPGPGRSLGPFEIITEIGRGGMGVVYRSIQQPLGREVALKVLPPEFTALPSRVKRFQREAEAISRLDHPHIIPIYAFGKAGGYHYFAMKFIKGGTLAKMVETMREPLGAPPPDDENFAMNFASVADGASPAVAPPVPAPPPETALAKPLWNTAPPASAHTEPAYIERVLRIFVKVAGAISHAHQNGILHRDLKPANIILDEDAEPFVLDFGLARDETDLTLSESQSLCGTPCYMAPEQIQPDGQSPDRRTDVWGLGVALYEVLALRQPFSGSTRDQLFAEIVTAHFPPLRTLNKGVSRELEGVLRKALERDRERRYQDVDAFAADLQSVLEGREPEAKPTSSLHQVVVRASRHRVPTGLALVGGLLLAGLSLAIGIKVAASFGTPPPSPPRPPSAASIWQQLPKTAAVLVVVAENPADGSKPLIEILPAAYVDGENAVVVPRRMLAAMPEGFDPATHGILMWAATNAVIPLELDDPGMYRAGAGFARNLSRFRAVLPRAVKALPQMAGLGKLGPSTDAGGPFVAYRLDGSSRPIAASESRGPSWTAGATVPAQCLALHVNGGVVDQVSVDAGSFSVTEGGRRLAPAFPRDATGHGGLVLGQEGDLIGYLAPGGEFLDLGWLRR